MPQADKIKEEIGWLKAIFALLVAIDISLIGWAAQNMGKASTFLLLLAAFTIVLVIWAIEVNRRAYRKIGELGEL